MTNNLSSPPKGLAILGLIGPSIVWAAEYIGSGEVILATRNGAILGTAIVWAVVFGIFLKFWIGMSGARYTVCTGEGMIDMFDRMPGPRHWAVWIVLVAQLVAAAISIGSIASASGVFINSLIPLSPFVSGWLVTFLAFGVAWTGVFKWLKIVMSCLVLLIILGVLNVAVHVLPSLPVLFKGLLPNIPAVPKWALAAGVHENPWREILPLIGWGAGGFASQVWYSYWVLGAGYGVAGKRDFSQPANLTMLKKMTKIDGQKIQGWCKVVYADASLAMVIGIVVTVSFLLAGAGILSPMKLAPDGENVAISLSNIFSANWGRFGGFLFLLGGTAALVSTLIGQLAGWPRLLADSFRICLPKFNTTFSQPTQFRLFLIFFLCTNMIIVYSLGYKPVVLVKLGAVLDGLLLTPLQALWILMGLYIVLPKLYQSEVAQQLKPHWLIAVGLIVAFLMFGYFCLFQIPFIL